MVNSLSTTLISTGRSRVEIVHNAERCFGFATPRGAAWHATWSGNRFDDHYIGTFRSKRTAIAAVLRAAR
jgi:hypothetical protein